MRSSSENHSSSTMISPFVKMQISLAIFRLSSAICFAENFVCLSKARAADSA